MIFKKEYGSNTVVPPIFSVQCTMTNGFYSPEFASRNGKAKQTGECNFNHWKTPIRFVTAKITDDQTMACLQFKDWQGRVVTEFSPSRFISQIEVTSEIGSNEEIIGVFGLKNARKWFKGFGLILLKRHF